MSIEGWAWLIVPLGLCRATQIVLHDRVLRGPRDWLLRRLNPRGYSMADGRRPYLSFLLECPWCMSVWLGGAAAALLCWDKTRRPTLWVLLALALSLAAVVLDRAVDRWFPDEPVNEVPPVYVERVLGDVHMTGDNPTGPS